MPSRKRIWRLVSIAVGFVLLALGVTRLYGVRWVLFPTWMLRKVTARPLLEHAEVWTLTADGATVEAFFFPAGPHASTVIFTHGNGELIDDELKRARWYQEHGFSVLLPEYRGYGRSGGTPTEAALVSDFVAFYDRLRANPAVDASHIYFHGRSLGGAVACAAALERRPRALILESTFTSVRQLARERNVPSFLVADSFDSEDAIADSTLPVLLIHGRQDTIVPVQHAVTLASVLPSHTLLLLSCGHNDCPLPAEEILQFLDTAGR